MRPPLGLKEIRSYRARIAISGITIFLVLGLFASALILIAQDYPKKNGIVLDAGQKCTSATAKSLLGEESRSGELWIDLLRATSSEPALDTSTWKVYTSDHWGFSLRYPPSWRIDSFDNQPDGVSISFLAKPKGFDTQTNLLLLNVYTIDQEPQPAWVAAMGQIGLKNPKPSPMVEVGPSALLRASFRLNGVVYRFADTFSTVPERDGQEIAAIIRSLEFTCPEE